MIALETKRLIVRQAVPKDVEPLARFFRDNREFHNRIDRPESHYTAAYWKKQIQVEHMRLRRDQAIHFYLFIKGIPHEPIGMIVFDSIQRGYFQSCFLGYLLGQDFQGKGYMSEALEVAISFVFKRLNLHRISAGHVLTNKRSCKVLEGQGFKAIGIEPKYLRINGKWQDHEVHTLINNDWKPKNARV